MVEQATEHGKTAEARPQSRDKAAPKQKQIAHQLSQKQLVPPAILSPIKRGGLANGKPLKGLVQSASQSQPFTSNKNQLVSARVEEITLQQSKKSTQGGHPKPSLQHQREAKARNLAAASQRQPAAKKPGASLGKKKGAATEEKGAFSLAPYHEQLMAQMGPVSSSEEESEYDDYGSERDPSNDSYWFTSSEEDDEEGELDPEEIAFKNNRLVMYARHTHYDVIKEVAKFNFEYHLTKRENAKWDLAWFDGPITIKMLQLMQPYQRTNHFPGIYNLAKKNMLGRHLMRLQSVFPDDYDFFPPTYNLPADFKEFVAQITQKRNRTFIVKPEASCQGKGIFLTRDPETLTTEKTVHTSQAGVVEHMVVQRYMHKPYLIDGFKFDLRIYVLINGISPLRVYVFKDGLARFATVKYQNPAPSNLSNLCMHLTNYAINKESSQFVQNANSDADDVGSKRSYQFVLNKLAKDYGLMTMDRVKNEINEIIVKTMCLAQPHVHHLYRSCQPDDAENSLCFQILGFDIMLDHKLKASLIEVNQMPSFQTDSPLDYKIKQGVINDCVALLNLSTKRRNRIKNQKRQELQRRLLKGYSHKIPAHSSQLDGSASKDESALSFANQANSSVQGSSSLNRAASKAALQTGASGKESGPGPRGSVPQVSKANMRNLAMQSKQDLIIKKRIQREQSEAALCGGYELIYPFVSYAEEERIRLKVIQLQKSGHQQRSVKTLIGLDAPKTLKEKLAEKNEPNSATKPPKEGGLNQRSSQKSLLSQEPRVPQLGENTIELSAAQQLMDEECAANDSNQQGKSNERGTLTERWLKQVKYENFMECARKMWDQFTSGAHVKQQRRLRAKAELREKQQADQQRKDRAKRELARKQLTQKLRRQAEERRLQNEQRARMAQIEEEEKERERSHSNESKSKSQSKLNMAELREQHKKLTEKINESQKKVLEDGLRRARKSSQYERQEVRKSITNLTLSQEIAATKLAPQVTGVSGAGVKIAGPNTDYFKHVQQRYHEKQQKLMQESMQNEKMRQLNPGPAGVAENSNSQPLDKRTNIEFNSKPTTAAQLSTLSFARDCAKEEGASRDQPRTEQKQKNNEFPLDLVLPVFKLNKNEASFIPTLKMKSKEGFTGKEKPKGGLIKGSTVHQHPHASSGPAYGKNVQSPRQRRMESQASESTLPTMKSPQVGYTFRDRKQSRGAELMVGQGTSQGEILPPKTYNSHHVKAPTDQSVLDSFRPIGNQKNLLESNLQLIQKLGPKKAAHISTKEMLLEKEKQVYNSLEPLIGKVSPGQAHKGGTFAQSGASKMREPNVVMINLDMPHSVPVSSEFSAQNLKEASAKQLRPMFKSPQTDKWGRDQPVLESVSSFQVSTLQHKSHKIQSLTSNMQVSKIPFNRNSKLNELFGEAQPERKNKRQLLNEAGSAFENARFSHSEAISLGGMNSTGTNPAEALLRSSKQATIDLTAASLDKPNIIKIQRAPLAAHHKRTAMLPEISSQHISKEMGNFVKGARAVSNQSQINPQLPSDFGAKDQGLREGSVRHYSSGQQNAKGAKQRQLKLLDSSAISGVVGHLVTPDLQQSTFDHINMQTTAPNSSQQDTFGVQLNNQARKIVTSLQRNLSMLGHNNQKEIGSAQLKPTKFQANELMLSSANRTSQVHGAGSLEQPQVELDMVSGVSLRHQKELLQKAGLFAKDASSSTYKPSQKR